MMTAKDESTRTRWMLKAHFTADMLDQVVRTCCATPSLHARPSNHAQHHNNTCSQEHSATVGRRARRAILHQEYMAMAKTMPPVSTQGSRVRLTLFLSRACCMTLQRVCILAPLAQGQVRAVWRHRVTRDDVHTLRTACFPLLVVHGRHDIVTPPVCGAKLAVTLKCPLVLLEGAHFLTRDQAPAINQLLAGIVFGEVGGMRMNDINCLLG